MNMGRGRLEAFSDGVIAIIITIMVLELKVPDGDSWSELSKLGPKLLSYILSFINVGIYWNNHHHLLHAVERVSGGILWSNMLLLFWLSLMPFTTGWMGENHFSDLPVAVYAFDLLMCAISYEILQRQIIHVHGKDSILAKAVGNDTKGKVSVLAYLLSIPLALIGYSWIAGGLLITVALIWFIPDRRIEKKLMNKK
jgi:uncharacterized membrane protein